MLLAVIAVGVLAVASGRASAATVFPTSPMLDNFATDTVAERESDDAGPGRGSVPLDTGYQELTGVDANDVGRRDLEPTVHLAGRSLGDDPTRRHQRRRAYVNVTGGESGTVHDSSGYFVAFDGSASGGATDEVSLWRIDNSTENFMYGRGGPVHSTSRPGDQIGLSVSAIGRAGSLWYKPSGGTVGCGRELARPQLRHPARSPWRRFRVPTTDSASFGGGTPATPVQTAVTTSTSIGSSAAGVTAGQPVTYTATVSPAPDGGTISFADGGVPIPTCTAQPVSGQRYGHLHGDLPSCRKTRRQRPLHRIFGRRVRRLDEGSRRNRAEIARPSTNRPKKPEKSDKLIATTTSLSLSSATPATGTAGVYTATVSPAPDGGTVSFTDGAATIPGCTAQPVTNGTSTCKCQVSGLPGCTRSVPPTAAMQSLGRLTAPRPR